MKKIIVVVICLILLVGCSKDYEPLDVEGFKDIANEANLEMRDATNDFEVGLVESVIIAASDEIRIEFFVLLSDDQAISAYEQNVEMIENIESKTASYFSKSNGNHSNYARTTDERYYITARIDDTTLYAFSTIEQKQALKDLIEQMQYR